MFPGVGPILLRSFLRFRSERRYFSIRWIDDQGGAQIRRAAGIAIPPEIVVRAHGALGWLLIAGRSREDFGFVGGHFLCLEKLLALEFFGPLQGDYRGIA